MSETLFSLLMVIGAVGIFWLGWHLRGERDKPPVTTKPPTSHVTRPSHHVSAPTRALYKIEPPSLWTTPDVAFIGDTETRNLLEPIDMAGPSLTSSIQDPVEQYIQKKIAQAHQERGAAANKRNRERILANMRAGKRNN